MSASLKSASVILMTRVLNISVLTRRSFTFGSMRFLRRGDDCMAGTTPMSSRSRPAEDGPGGEDLVTGGGGVAAEALADNGDGAGGQLLPGNGDGGEVKLF